MKPFKKLTSEYIDSDKVLTDVDYWLNIQNPVIDLPAGGTCPSWYKHVSDLLPSSPESNCIEVGAVPGTTLLFLAKKLNYSCTGIDFSPRVQDLNTAFIKLGISAKFIKADFLTWQSEELFNLVYSNGFIEHFEDYQSVIKKHWDLVKPGGLMLLTVPTLTPLQKLIRVIFYKESKMQEVLAIHNVKIMNLVNLKKSIQKLDNAIILKSNYISEFKIWFSSDDPFIRSWTKPLFKPLFLLSRLLYKANISNSFFSPEALILVRKKNI